MASSRVSSPEDAEQVTRHISDLVDGIPLDLLAQAAFHCGAHARALQYYESYVRTERGGALNPAARRSATYDDAEVTFLQVQPFHLQACLNTSYTCSLYSCEVGLGLFSNIQTL